MGAIDAAFWLYRRHFAVLFLISLIVNVPTTVAGLLVTFARFHLDRAMANGTFGLAGTLPSVLLFAASLFATLLIAMIAGIFGMAASTQVASAAALDLTPTLAEALAAARTAFWRLLGASLIASLASLCGLLLFAVPGVVLYLGLSFIGPIIVLERAGVSEAIERSWQLSMGRRGKICAALALVLVLIAITAGGLSSIAALTAGQGNLVTALLNTMAAQVVAALATPVWYVAIVLLYYDARVEHEAFDVQALSGSAGLPESLT